MDREMIIKAAKHCEHNTKCDGCPFFRSGTSCIGNFRSFIVDNFSCTEPNPLLTRWDAEKPTEIIDRAYILDTAKRMVTGKREQDYGSPEDNFKLIGDMWSAYCGVPIGAMDVAAMMAILKIARIGTGTATDDSWIDLAGYAACGGEIACKQKVIEVEA